MKNINTTDTLAPTCGRTVSQISTLLTNIDKTTALGKNTQLDPGEKIWYTCETQGVTFPGNINILQTMGTAVNSFATTVKDESNTLASYGDTPSVKIDVRSGAKNDFQNINATGVADFYVEISNNGFSPLDTISTTSLLAPSCNRTAAQIAQLIKAQGNKDTILDAIGSEKISYTCSTSGVTYPNNINTITVRATTVNTKNSDVPVFYGFDKNYNSKTVDTLDVPYSSLLASSIADDTYLFGNHPVHYNNVDSIYSCTDEVQCEWYCPAATPYYCSFTNSCVSSSAVCTPAC